MIPNILLNRPKPRPQSDEAVDYDAAMQWWYFDAILDNGCRLMTFFLPRNYNAVEGHEFGYPMLNVVLRKPGGEIIRERRFFAPFEMKPVANNFGAEFGEECLAVFERGRYILKVKAGRIAYDLELEPEIPSWSPFSASGRMPRVGMMIARRSLFTKDYAYYVPFVPRGRLSGQITLGSETINASGSGYHEQGRVSFPLHEMVPAW